MSCSAGTLGTHRGTPYAISLREISRKPSRSALIVCRQGSTSRSDKGHSHAHAQAHAHVNHKIAPHTFATTAVNASRMNSTHLFPLHAACRAHDAKRVCALLASFEADIHQLDPAGLSALHVACEAGNVEIAELLLRRGFANVDMRAGGPAPGPGPGPVDMGSSPALPVPAQGEDGGRSRGGGGGGGRGEAISATASSSSSSNTFAGMAPLHIAAIKGNMPLIHMLLRKPHEATPDIACSAKGRTAFIYACQYGELHTATALIDEGLCRPQMRDTLGYTALHAACESGHTSMVQYLLSLPVLWLNAVDTFGFTPLLRACLQGHDMVVRRLLKEGADISHKNFTGETALSLSCAGGHVNIARILVLEPSGGELHSREVAIEEGAGAGAGKGLRMKTPILPGDVQLQGLNRETTQDAANVDVKDNLGWTALHFAAAAGHIDMINVCISELGCSVNMRTKRGETALHLAAARGNSAAVNSLIVHGARVDVQHQYGRTPLHLSAANGHDAVVLLLVDKFHANTNCIDDDGRTPLHDAAAGGYTSTMRILLQEGRAKVDIQKVGGRTALHVAAQTGVVSALKLLVLDHKADVSLTTTRGDSALHIASQFGKNACIKFLLDNGANLVLQNNNGQTPLDVAGAASKRGAVALLENAMARQRQQQAQRVSTKDEKR